MFNCRLIKVEAIRQTEMRFVCTYIFILHGSFLVGFGIYFSLTVYDKRSDMELCRFHCSDYKRTQNYIRNPEGRRPIERPRHR
jgi:hypothetical protein